MNARLALAAGLLLLLLAAWLARDVLGRPPLKPDLRGRPPLRTDLPPDERGAASTSPAPKTAAPPKAPVVLVVGRLVEPGGFAPIPALLDATRIVPIGAALKPVVPGDDGGFSFYWPRPGEPVAFEIRTAFHAVLGSRTVVDELGTRRVDLSAATDGATLDAGDLALPASDALSWVEGSVQSSSGAAIDRLDVELVGEEDFEGERLRALDRRPQLGHPPNVPARYVLHDRFLLRHVRPGRYALSVGARGHRRTRRPIDFPTAAPLPALTLTLERCSRAVSGRVVDADTGAALAGADVALVDGTRVIGDATSDAAGTFQAWLEEDPASPELRLVVWADGYEKAERTFPAGNPPVHREIALSRKR